MTRRQQWLGVVGAILVPVLVWGADVVLPHMFAPGQTIRAAEVNANFEALRAAVNAMPSGTAVSYVVQSPQASVVRNTPVSEIGRPDINARPNAIVSVVCCTGSTCDSVPAVYEDTRWVAYGGATITRCAVTAY